MRRKTYRTTTLTQGGLTLLLAVLLALTALVGVAPQPAYAENTDDSVSLTDTLWVLVAYGDALNPRVVEAGSVVTAVFNADGSLSGTGGCNNYTASYYSDGYSLVVEGVGATKKLCPTGMEQEQLFFSALPQSEAYQIGDDGGLEITYDSEAPFEEVLLFKQGQQPLEGTEWILKSMGDPNAPQGVEAGTTITAVFIPEKIDGGTVTGSAGCNDYSAEYRVDEQRIFVSAAATTRKACPVGMEQESLFLEALTDAETYLTFGESLEINYDDGDGQLVFSSTQYPLQDIEWVLESLNGRMIPAEVRITALFQPWLLDSYGQVTGWTGCNSFSAWYEAEGNGMTVGPISAGSAVCPQLEELESVYLRDLQAAKTYDIMGDRLEITTSRGSLVYTSQRMPLEGTLWELVSIGAVDGTQYPIPETHFTAIFTPSPDDSPSGLMTGSSGCNEYGSDYIASLTRIKINLPRKQQNDCGDAIREREQQYFLGLNDATSYRILGDELEIFFDDRHQVMTFAGTPLPEGGRIDLSPLDSTFWYLVTLVDKPLLPETQITAEFTIEDNRIQGTVNGSAGCNDYQAAIEPGFWVIPGGITLKMCGSPDGIMEQETAYLSALGTASSFFLQDDLLIMPTDGGLLVFSKDPPPKPTSPVAIIDAPGKANRGELVLFDGSRSRSRYPISLYFWQFGDGFRGNGAQVSHAYQFVGTFLANLTVVDSAGFTGTSGKTIQIIEAEVPPTAIIQSPTHAFSGQLVTYISRSTPGSSPIVSYQWDLATPAQSYGENNASVATVYSTPGWYDVSLTVTDANGLSNTTTRWIIILPPPSSEIPPTAIIEGPTYAYVGETVTFVSRSQPGSSPIAIYQWDLSGQASTHAQSSSSASVVYSNPGSYSVRLTVTDTNGLSNSTSHQIVIYPQDAPPNAVIEGPTQAYVGDQVTFVSRSQPGSSPIVSYQWGLSTRSVAPYSTGYSSLTTVFNRPGTYTVSLKVTDANGYSDTDTHQITISQRPPQYPPTARIEGPSQAFVNQQVTFVSRSTPGSSPIVSYAWDLGTRSASAASTADVSVTTSFSQPGTYTIRLSVTDANGLSDDDTHQITIAQQAQPPTALIEGPTQAYVGEPVTFTSRSTPGSSPIVSYHWDLTGRSSSYAQSNVSVTTSYSQPGTYTVSLTVTDANGLRDTDTHQITISQRPQQTPPTARIEGPTQASVGEPVTFTSRSTPGSSPIVSYAWDLGTRSASAASTADVSVTTSFSQPGTYTIRLRVTDANGLSDDDTHQITIAQQAQPPTALIEGPTQASVGE
ncbi:MAG: PKD domain-containing protein, partial [Chloroflexota bacterium]|nr:PKD domain-containing protein [Chloroflexota bacterium]